MIKRKNAEAQIEFYKNWEPTQEMYDEAANHKTGLKRFQLMWQLHHKISHLNGEMGILKVNSLYAKKSYTSTTGQAIPRWPVKTEKEYYCNGLGQVEIEKEEAQ